MAVYPIFTLPCRRRLCPTESKQQVGMYEVQAVEGFKERWDGPTSGMLREELTVKRSGARELHFPLREKTSFLSSGSIVLWALPFSKGRYPLGCPSLPLSPFCEQPPNTKTNVYVFLNFLGLQSCSILMSWVCASFFLTPLLSSYILVVTWAVSNCISADDGSVVAIYKSVNFCLFQRLSPTLP